MAGSNLPAYSGSLPYSDIPPVALLATTPQQHAVLMRTDRQLITLTIDDELGESGAHIVEILSDRIVLQQQALDDRNPPRLIWLYRAETPDQSSRIVTLERIPPAQPPTLQPAITTLLVSPAAGSRY